MECFTIYANEIEGRIDPFYYRPEFRIYYKTLLNNKNIIKGKDIFIKIESGIGVKPENLTNEGLRYIEVNSILLFEISKENLFVNKKERVKTLDKGDIVTGRVGSISNFALFEDNEKVAFSDNILRIKIKENINEKFILFLLNSSIVKKQIDRYKKGSLQNVINQQTLNSLILILPPPATQNRIVELMEKAYSSKKSKEAEAEQILDSINGYVLSEFGIKLPESKDKMIYVVNSDDVQNKRADAYYYQPKFEEVEKAVKKGKFEVKELKDSFEKELVKGILPNEKEKEGEIKVLQIKNILKNGLINTSEYVTAKNIFKPEHKIKKEEVIIVITGATIGKVGLWYSNEDFYLGGDMVKFSANDKFNSYYIQAFLLSQLGQYQLLREITGATNKHLSPDGVKKLKIPLPSLSIQNKIAEEVKKRMQRAEQLQKEAKEELEKAKAEVENMILENHDVKFS